MSRDGLESPVTVKADFLEGVEPGITLDMSAPVFGDVIQVERAYSDGVTRIDLTREEDRIVIRRQDNRPIQIEGIPAAHLRASDYVGTQVFVEPVEEVVFHDGGDGSWIVDGEVIDERSVYTLKSFALRVGIIARRKIRDGEFKRIS